MDIIVSIVNSMPDAARYLFIDSPAGHVLVFLLKLAGCIVFEDGSITLP